MRHQTFTSEKHTTGERVSRLTTGSMGATSIGREERGTTMKRALALGFLVTALAAAAAVAGLTQTASAKPAAGSLVGTGSTFVYPLVSKWIPAIDKAYGINLTYSPTGSGAGIAQVTARTVDFGAS